MTTKRRQEKIFKEHLSRGPVREQARKLAETATKVSRKGLTERPSVFSSIRELSQPEVDLPTGFACNRRLQMDGLKLLRRLPDSVIPVAFLDPQYRGVLDHLRYGNEGERRGRARSSLVQMTETRIREFVQELDRVLASSGHLFLWMDKYHLCSGFGGWLEGVSLQTVDMVTWDKERRGMGYRTRRSSEHLVVLQKPPRRAKGVWKRHDIPDVWHEQAKRGGGGVHPKPVKLQAALIEAVSNEGDLVLDPAAGTFSVLEACEATGRNFLGCDING